jgi:uncharacterized protein
VKKKSNRGFAGMSPERVREIASMGGKSVPADKRSFSRSAALAAKAGRKGGGAVSPDRRSFAQDHDLAVRAGKAGGAAGRTRKL